MYSLVAASYLAPAGFSLVIQTAVLVVAVIAARRYKLKGLWILAAAVFLTTLQALMNLVFLRWFQGGHDNAMTYWAWLQYIPMVTLVMAFCGWCLLAFGRKEKAGT